MPRGLICKSFVCAAAIAAAGCAVRSDPSAQANGSVVPGTIGIAVKSEGPRVVVTTVGRAGAAASAGLRVGDVIVRYNGEPIADARHFERLVLESSPGSVARVEFVREGSERTVELRVDEIVCCEV